MSSQLPALKSQWTGDTDFRTFSSKNQDHSGLMEKALSDVYAPNFPASVGYHTFEMFQEMLENPSCPIDCRIIVAGKNLRDENEKPLIKGIAIGFYYKDSDTAQLTYLAVDDAYRAEGLGHALFRQYEQAILDCAKDNNSTLQGHYISCQAPEKRLKETHQFYDTYDPNKRFQKYEAWGGQRVHFDYKVAYFFNDELQLDDDYALLALKNPADASYPTANATIGFMQSLWSSGGIENPLKEPTFQKMIKPLQEQSQPAGPITKFDI